MKGLTVKRYAVSEDILCLAGIPLSHKEARASDPKNLVYFFQEDRESPGHLIFIFYEVWTNQTDFEAHNNMPYVKAWFAKLPALADDGVKVTKMRILGKGAK